jgi:putative beta-lysine N-acetyltransferase
MPEEPMAEATKDKLEQLLGARIQHGPYNDRIYVMKLGKGDRENTVAALLRRARKEGYSKVFAKVPADASQAFTDKGFRVEAKVPGFFNGTKEAVFLGAYLDPRRKREEAAGELDGVLRLALSKRGAGVPPVLDSRFSIRQCGEEDIARMAFIYSTVFPTYPFPIQEAGYLLETMRSHVDYFAIECGGELVALSSAEMDLSAGNVEMTDFATLPDWRGNGFGVALLHAMEEAMRRKGLATAYTIARAASAGMNITFAKLGYEYGGRLVNNTNISGRIESMNIWYKPLLPAAVGRGHGPDG